MEQFSSADILSGSFIGAAIGAIIGCVITYVTWSKMQEDREFILTKKISKIASLKETIEKLKVENTELRFRPGNIGYREAETEFNELSQE